ncbi:HAD hydrolase-like protein [Vibrio parahaemolyticus]|uniref:phosphoglycolate phosphatase n=1 Tax=Vibrio parahaemolyticus TaxID=670 RepID=A0A5P5X5U8_VIBPH|nr:HAD family hydrolase [Vibrio parahaemolyticus]HCZ9305280.1 HAD family hydrolase [Vibrio alginolyticus]EGQ8161753.1 HAD family hydrolase [Vibrio parahaemolyticus]EGQ8292044.1 HAD hydrolase-like protein [Vibrio parahaemolyticus]EGQ8326380.1 HAD hydrolase-like protein [Vibrio parahaemolyticus]EGQ8354816.1 HAD hydrolase-like protein [Vibrio parahaemolyticus]
MPLLSEYEVYIFDCDGVILDSNQLKIEAMKNALEAHFSAQDLIAECVDYFRHNFGKSRFHHVAHFLDSILTIEEEKRSELEQRILADFSKQCRTLYLTAQLTPGFMSFLEQCQGKRYVASGSEQSELRDVFVQRGLDTHFDGVFGSPTPKAELIRYILKQENSTNAVMFGDAESDMLSAQQNHIDFVFYAPYSNVKEKMIEQCHLQQHLIIDDFSTVRF